MLMLTRTRANVDTDTCHSYSVDEKMFNVENCLSRRRLQCNLTAAVSAEVPYKVSSKASVGCK